jgi:hypothetical protein
MLIPREAASSPTRPETREARRPSLSSRLKVRPASVRMIEMRSTSAKSSGRKRYK